MDGTAIEIKMLTTIREILTLFECLPQDVNGFILGTEWGFRTYSSQMSLDLCLGH